MKPGDTLVHVPDVAASLAFFTAAFGLPRKCLPDGILVERCPPTAG